MRTNIKRFVSLVLVLSMVFAMTLTVSATENEPLLSMNGPETVLHGSAFSVTVDASAAVSDGKLTLTYDASVLTFVAANAGEAWPQEADLSFQANDNGNGKLILAFAGAVDSKTGALFELTFKAGETLGVTEVALDSSNSYVTGNTVVDSAAAVEVVCHAANFPDVKDEDWFHEGVDYVVDKGYMEGMPGGVFAPATDTNRAMVVVILHRMAGSPAVEGSMPFVDVKADDWFHDAVLWAYQNDIVKGTSETTFDGAKSVLREQMAAFFQRYAAWKGEDVSASADLSGFVDANRVSGYAVDAMEWAVATGIIQGMPGDILDPVGTANRAEVATMIVRLDKVLEN